MEKIEFLIERMLVFRAMLILDAPNDSMLGRLLEELQPLFREIEIGRIVPPQEGLFEQPFQGEGTTYGYPHPLYSAAAEFRGALEDWRSKPWWPEDQP